MCACTKTAPPPPLHYTTPPPGPLPPLNVFTTTSLSAQTQRLCHLPPPAMRYATCMNDNKGVHYNPIISRPAVDCN